jgi:hypothetical protein
MNTNKDQTPKLPQTDVITRFNFYDLSFSGIVNEIDGDENTCKDFIIEVYYQIEKQRKIVDEIKRNLHNEESYLRSLENSIDLAMKHLHWQKPLALIINKGTYNELLVISNSAVTLEKNVL